MLDLNNAYADEPEEDPEAIPAQETTKTYAPAGSPLEDQYGPGIIGAAKFLLSKLSGSKPEYTPPPPGQESAIPAEQPAEEPPPGEEYPKHPSGRNLTWSEKLDIDVKKKAAPYIESLTRPRRYDDQGNEVEIPKQVMGATASPVEDYAPPGGSAIPGQSDTPFTQLGPPSNKFNGYGQIAGAGMQQAPPMGPQMTLKQYVDQARASAAAVKARGGSMAEQDAAAPRFTDDMNPMTSSDSRMRPMDQGGQASNIQGMPGYIPNSRPGGAMASVTPKRTMTNEQMSAYQKPFDVNNPEDRNRSINQNPIDYHTNAIAQEPETMNAIVKRVMGTRDPSTMTSADEDKIKDLLTKTAIERAKVDIDKGKAYRQQVGSVGKPKAEKEPADRTEAMNRQASSAWSKVEKAMPPVLGKDGKDITYDEWYDTIFVPRYRKTEATFGKKGPAGQAIPSGQEAPAAGGAPTADGAPSNSAPLATGELRKIRQQYDALTPDQKNQVLAYTKSLKNKNMEELDVIRAQQAFIAKMQGR